MGRKALPTGIKLWKGNPGRRPLNPAEPKHPIVDTAVPDQLQGNETATAEWQRVIEQLTVTGHITSVDRSMLIAYCETWALYTGLIADAKGQPFVVKAPSGYPVPNPTIGMANKACALLVRLAAELGITPSSRSKVVAIPNTPETPDAFTAYQRQRRG